MTLYIDFEFNNTTSKYVNLVCCTTYDSATQELLDWWLLNDQVQKDLLKHYILERRDRPAFTWAATAEARSYIALGINPARHQWIDGFLEFRCLTNHNDNLNWGEQLVDGKVKDTKKPPPKWERTEEDTKNSFKHTHSLAEATYKLTKKIRDTEHKDKMRDIIISGDERLIMENQYEIMAYCREDVIFLPEIHAAILGEYKKLGVKLDEQLTKEMLSRGHYAALTAKMETIGYPINYQATLNFSNSVGAILEECQREINNLFPDIRPFRYSRREQKFSWNQSVTKAWLKENVDISRWMKTDGYKKAQKEARAKKTPIQNPEKYLSLSGDAFQKVFDFKHEYPKDNFGAQMVRYLKLSKDLNGFKPTTSTKKTFWDSVGPDRRVRPYFNIFGSQSSRSQPGARGYLHLKPAWMRSLCQPDPGRAIASFDYGSEEFLISALISNCQNMKDAYISGDVYLYFGKLAGAIPWDGKKEDYKALRNLFKALTLGISYQMTAIGLAGHLTQNAGRKYTEEEAQELIDTFEEAYPELKEWQLEIMEQYEDEGHIKLPDGWYIWGDNENFRSVCNVPIQGLGASVMRKAVELCDEAGIDVIITLHDALYIEYDSFDFEVLDTFRECMRQAFIFFFEDKKTAAEIKLDGFTWSPDYPEMKVIEESPGKYSLECETITTPAGHEMDVAHMYIDERSIGEYLQFKSYFNRRAEDAL